MRYSLLQKETLRVVDDLVTEKGFRNTGMGIATELQKPYLSVGEGDSRKDARLKEENKREKEKIEGKIL